MNIDCIIIALYDDWFFAVMCNMCRHIRIHTDKQRRAHTRTHGRALIQGQTHDMHKRSAYKHIRLYLTHTIYQLQSMTQQNDVWAGLKYFQGVLPGNFFSTTYINIYILTYYLIYILT